MKSCSAGAFFSLGVWKEGAQQGSGIARGEGDGVSKCQAVCFLLSLSSTSAGWEQRLALRTRQRGWQGAARPLQDPAARGWQHREPLGSGQCWRSRVLGCPRGEAGVGSQSPCWAAAPLLTAAASPSPPSPLTCCRQHHSSRRAASQASITLIAACLIVPDATPRLTSC